MFLEGLEGFYLGFSPCKWCRLLGVVDQWSCDLRVVFDEVSVVSCESQEGSDVPDCSWGFPVRYSLYLGWVHPYGVVAQDDT
jgi:hypothetical protein